MATKYSTLKIGSTKMSGKVFDVPADLAPAFSADRSELIRLVKVRPLTADEHKVYLNLIAQLMDWNRANKQLADNRNREVVDLRKRISMATQCMAKMRSTLLEATADDDEVLRHLESNENVP